MMTEGNDWYSIQIYEIWLESRKPEIAPHVRRARVEILTIKVRDKFIHLTLKWWDITANLDSI